MERGKIARRRNGAVTHSLRFYLSLPHFLSPSPFLSLCLPHSLSATYLAVSSIKKPLITSHYLCLSRRWHFAHYLGKLLSAGTLLAGLNPMTSRLCCGLLGNAISCSYIVYSALLPEARGRWLSTCHAGALSPLNPDLGLPVVFTRLCLLLLPMLPIWEGTGKSLWARVSESGEEASRVPWTSRILQRTTGGGCWWAARHDHRS